MVFLRIDLSEVFLEDQVRALGVRWGPERDLWFIPYGCIAGTDLEKFIVLETVNNKTG